VAKAAPIHLYLHSLLVFRENNMLLYEINIKFKGVYYE
jgi:hypothetical protein